MDSTKIQELYSFTSEEQELFDYAREYMRKVRKRLPFLLETQNGRERFVLAGLFLTYRACNHIGTTMSTDNEGGLTGLHKERLSLVTSITGKKIRSTEEFLKLIGYSPLKVILLRVNTASFLIRFVLKKTDLKWD